MQDNGLQIHSELCLLSPARTMLHPGGAMRCQDEACCLGRCPSKDQDVLRSRNVSFLGEAAPEHPVLSWQAPGAQPDEEQLLHCMRSCRWVGSAEGARKCDGAEMFPDSMGHWEQPLRLFAVAHPSLAMDTHACVTSPVSAQHQIRLLSVVL